MLDCLGCKHHTPNGECYIGTIEHCPLEKKTNYYPDCPIFDISCPYCLASGECTIGDPINECDDYYYYMGETD